MTSFEVREQLVRALQLDLLGPDADVGNPAEVLPHTPSRWYLTGFLIPVDAPESQKADETVEEELDAQGEGADIDESTSNEGPAFHKSHYPSSCGMSFLVPKEASSVKVRVVWGDYKRIPLEKEGKGAHWQRIDRVEEVPVALVAQTTRPLVFRVPDAKPLELVLTVRPLANPAGGHGLTNGARSVSLFLVNRRQPSPDAQRDESFAFQVGLDVTCDAGFMPRPNPRGLTADDWDERVADLQYRDTCDYSVGHSVATRAVVENGACRRILTCWLPDHEVERVAPVKFGWEFVSMDLLGNLADGQAARAALQPMVDQYRQWIDKQASHAGNLSERRDEVCEELTSRARSVAKRIENGIDLLADADCLKAFRLANRAMAEAARRRQGVMQGNDPEAVKPKWYPFQLAFLLMNLKGIAQPGDGDRNKVDLLFFPTGGGKTEAYLGLAAFTLVLRRLRNPGIASAGLSVLMRYTLRLLTLDQLGRASTLICALENERLQDKAALGEWPFQIGLWVGRAATPNHMGALNDNNQESARAKTIAHLNDDKKPSPVPLENCPWCGAKFTRNSFKLSPNRDQPLDLHIVCVNRDCDFSGDRPLPIIAVDEPIYRRLPCFLIATVDKFAAMPWTGEVGGLFGQVERYDANGFYGPCAEGVGRRLPVDRLLPPDLVIQDELHLISGPLGTLVGLYETAIDELSSQMVDGKKVYPKIVASTATVRRAESQIRALFNRSMVDIFPPPGPDRRDSFFAQTLSPQQSPARMYLGIPSQGRSSKVVQLRVYLVLLAAAKRLFDLPENQSLKDNPADPYMTLLGYFNSLRELGGTRRLVEGEVYNGLEGYTRRKRVGETESPFALRTIEYEPVELTSRISTGKVSEYKRRLEIPFQQQEKGKKTEKAKSGAPRPVDLAIATNMISVGLDITRLGLMVVYGQPKTSAEYIQATSRVGRSENKPGLVVTILNLKKPRDRSHYEQFSAYHESFYRSVEATSVTPFSPRALDKGLAGVVVALARQGNRLMTKPVGAAEIMSQLPQLDWLTKVLVDRATKCCGLTNSEEKQAVSNRVKARVSDLLDSWAKEAEKLKQNGVILQYQMEASGTLLKRLLYEFLHPDLKNLHPKSVEMKFRANRSMRDVEPSVNLFVHRLNGKMVDGEDD